LAAAQGGDFDALLAVLDPDVVLRADALAVPAGAPTELRGAELVARNALLHRAVAARAALVDGAPGIVVAPAGHLRLVLVPTIVDGIITEFDVIAEPARLEAIELALLP